MIVEQATAEEIVAYVGMWGWIGCNDHVGKPLCFAGFWRHSGRLWGFLDVFDAVPPLSLVRIMKKKIEEVEEDVYVMCNDTIHPSAPRLLRLLGFVPTDEIAASQMRVWKWQTR